MQYHHTPRSDLRIAWKSISFGVQQQMVFKQCMQYEVECI